MSYFNANDMLPHELISSFVKEAQGRGHNLDRDEHAIIDRWIEIHNNPDLILVTLAELYDEYEKKYPTRDKPNLKMLNKKLIRRITGIKGNV